MSNYQIQSYPTVILVKPDGTIENQYIWEPTTEHINEVVIAAGGLLTSVRENAYTQLFDNVELFPVPVNEMAFLEFSLKSEENLEFKVYDLPGNEVLKINEQRYFEGANKISLNVSDLNNGIYLLGILRDSRFIASKRLIIAN